MYLYNQKSKDGAYPALQSVKTVHNVEFPDKFIPEFYKEGKQAAGFVDIRIDNGIVVDCLWNETAYQAYMETHKPVPPAPTEMDKLKAQMTYTALMTNTIIPNGGAN